MSATNLTNIIITQPNGNRVPMQNRRTATGVVSAKQNWALNAEDTVDITVESPFPQTYNIGDRITIFGRDYKLNRLPSVKKTGMHQFQYDLKFEGVQYDLFRVIYGLTIDTTTNQLQDVQGDSLTGNLHRFMTVLVANANRVFPGKWKLGVCPDTIGDKTLTFGESDNCLSVLQNLCSNFNVEFDIVQADGVYTINLYERVGQILPFKFVYGRGGGVYDLNRQNVSSANIVTRLNVYGSTENITSKYRADRLCLPGRTKGQSYIEKAEMVAKYGIFEGRKNFDDVKPTFTGSVETKVDEFSFIDTKFPFDLNAKNADGETLYLINGVSAKIHFNTGNLAGYDFEVKAYDHATHKFTLIKTTDDRGDVFPSETHLAFQFAEGNEYKVLDIAYSPEIEAQAEADLEEVANKYYDQNCQPKVQYGLSIAKSYLANLASKTDAILNFFAPGDYLHVVDKDIDVDKAIRIKSFVRNILDPYEYTLTISDTVTSATITNRVISDLVELDKIVSINNLKDPTRARANWRSSREVLNMVFDPDGDYYTDKIKPNSIDTMALSVGAKSMQFGLMNTVFQPNFQGNNNVVKWQGGVLTHYTINEESAVSWVMADAQTTLTSNVPYYLYAKCEKNGTAGSFIFTASQIKVDEDANYYHFLVGTLSSIDPELKARSLALTYGFTMINGRFIKTGRIESADGTTYFDLDNSEIGGRIVFNSNGEEKTLEQLGAEALESKDFINNTLPGLLSEIQAQLDGQIEQFFETYDPTMNNAPAKDWTTTELKENHLGDLFYNTDTGAVYRFVKENGTYKWQQLSDDEVANALALANEALALAKDKNRIFTSTPYTPYDVGDLWVQGGTGEIMRCKTARASGSYTSSDWEKASKYTDDSGLNDFINGDYADDKTDILTQIDGKVETWFQTTDPSNVWTTAEKKKHVGDLWYNTETKESKRFSDSYSWEVLEDKDAKNALEAASKAQDTADGKRRVFVNTPTTPYDVGDLWVQGATGDIMRCKTTRTSGEYTATDWERASKYTGDEELNSFIDSIYTPAINEIFKQLDGVIETWFASGVPTLNNAPASDWTTNTDKDMHLGDIYYNNDDGTAYRFSKDGSVYKWIEISDSAIASAMQAAAEAQDTADGKRRVFVTTPTTPYDVGDLWTNGTFLKVCKNSKGKNAAYAESDWENATNYTSDESLHNFINGVFDETIGEIKSQIDGKIECWYQTTSPSTAWSLAEKPKHVGDMWFNTSSKELKYYRQLSTSSFLWTKVEDADAIAAQEAASKAQDTADGKRRVFVTTPTTPYDVGDLWVQGEDGDIMRCKTARASGSYSSSDWDKASKYTDDSGLNDFINNTYNPNIDDILEQIDGKVECWFQTTDPSGAWNTTALKKKHVGDMWYHTTKNELKYYTSSYAWKKVEDANALAAYDAASKAQDTADGKRQVFVDTPKVPYDIGDLWVDGKDLRRCQTKKTATQAYNVNDWVVAVAYDNTQTVIDGGLVTSGTIQVAGDNTSILAGITGNGTTSTSVRFWAGASFENRATAPFRVLQDGSLHATKAYIEGEIHATKGTFKNVDVYGSFRSPFVIISDSFKEQQSDNLYSQYLGSHLVCSLPWDNASSGRRITVIGSVSISAPSGKYFFEDGRTHSELSTSYEVVELLGWGGSSFQGYIVLSRTVFKSNYGHGRRIHPLAYGTVTGSSSSASIKYWSFDGNTMTVTRMSTGKYKITFPTNWFYSSDYIIALATGVGSNVGGDNPVYANIMTRYKSSTEAYIIVRTADDDSENDGAFTFMLYNASTWDD